MDALKGLIPLFIILFLAIFGFIQLVRMGKRDKTTFSAGAVRKLFAKDALPDHLVQYEAELWQAYQAGTGWRIPQSEAAVAATSVQNTAGHARALHAAATATMDKATVEAQIKALGDFYEFFTRKELEYLPEILTPSETIMGLTSGAIDGNTWLVVVTTKRVLCLDKGMVYGLRQLEIPIAQIKSISHSTGLGFGEINVDSAGATRTIKKIPKQDVQKIAKIISHLVHSRDSRDA